MHVGTLSVKSLVDSILLLKDCNLRNKTTFKMQLILMMKIFTHLLVTREYVTHENKIETLAVFAVSELPIILPVLQPYITK